MNELTRRLMLQATPGMIVPPTADLENRPRVKNSDGSISTVFSMSFDLPDGKTILVPGVRIGLSRKMKPLEAIEYAKKSGEHLGIFESRMAADRYAEQLHQDQAKILDKNPIEPYIKAWAGMFTK